MIKAGSLFYAVVVSLLITIISGFFILYSYFTFVEFDNFDIAHRLRLNVNSGLNLLLSSSSQEIVNVYQEKNIDLFGKGTDTVMLSNQLWGAFGFVKSIAREGNNIESKMAFIGSARRSDKNFAIYIEDDSTSLAVAGKTKIVGDAFLPKGGIKRAFIEGQDFSGNRLLEGKIFRSDKDLPGINPTIIKHLQKYFSNEFMNEKDSLISFSGSVPFDTLKNSFESRTVIIESPEIMNLSQGYYSGNIIFFSSKKIVVSKNVELEDVILLSPKIVFEEKFKGILQAFASDSIILKEDVRLNYPSCLGLIKKDSHVEVSSILMEGKDSVFGDIISFKSEKNINSITNIIVNQKCLIFGNIYSDSYVDFRARLFGSLFCKKIQLTSSSVWYNHLLNVEIDIKKYSDVYCGVDAINFPSKKKIIKWVN